MIEASVETIHIQAHYDNVSRFYKKFWGDHIHHGYWEDTESSAVAQIRLIEQLAAFARVKKGARVLDVGCGVGGSSVWLAENFGSSVLGLTISPVQVEMGRKLAAQAGVADRVSFAVQDANDLEGFNGFDLLWAIESTEHLRDKGGFFNAARRCLEPGGTLALCAWLVPDSFASARHRRLAKLVCEGMLCPSLASMHQHRDWMESAGFQDIRARDVTQQVESTWDHCARIARRPEVRLLLRATENRTQQFVAAFDVIRRAYREGAMSYGMFSGTLPRTEGTGAGT